MPLAFHTDRSSERATEPHRSSASASSVSSEEGNWNWPEMLAQIAYRMGALNLFGRLSQKYEMSWRNRGRLPAFQRALQPKYAILCYHRVGTEGIPYYSTLPPALFELQMRFLRENFRVISLSQLCHELTIPRNEGHGVAVTFDDGYSDLYTHALPVLRKFEIPATVYLTVDCIETGEVAWYDRIFLALQVAEGEEIELPISGRSRCPLGSPRQRVEAGTQIVSILRNTPVLERRRICAALEQQASLPADKLEGRMLSWKQIHEMRCAGISLGSHTLSHPVLSQLAVEDIDRELGESKRVLEARLGEPVLDFAFPFGKPEDYGPIAYAAVKRFGYRSAVTTIWGTNIPGSDMSALRRLRLGEERTGAKFGLQLHREFFQAREAAAPFAASGPAHWSSKGAYAHSSALMAGETDA